MSHRGRVKLTHALLDGDRAFCWVGDMVMSISVWRSEDPAVWLSWFCFGLVSEMVVSNTVQLSDEVAGLVWPRLCVSVCSLMSSGLHVFTLYYLLLQVFWGVFYPKTAAHSKIMAH